jgi:hypothetical protein
VPERVVSTVTTDTSPIRCWTSGGTLALIGQNSWVTVNEYERLLPWLNLLLTTTSLEVASSSGGPALTVAQLVVASRASTPMARWPASQMAAKSASSTDPFALRTPTQRLTGLLRRASMHRFDEPFPNRLAVFRMAPRPAAGDERSSLIRWSLPVRSPTTS